MIVPKAWYLLYFSALSCLFPYLNLFYRRLGFSERSIGILGAVRPFISLPAGSIWSGAADKSRCHRAFLLLMLCASVVARLSLAAVGRLGFGPLLAGVATTEFFAAPVTIIADAAVMAACTQQGDYGRQRLWGAVGWGIFAAVSGTAISHAGFRAAFLAHAALAALALLPTARLPFGPLHAKLAKQAGSFQTSGNNSSGISEEQQAGFDAYTAEAAAEEECGVQGVNASYMPRSDSSKGRVQRFDSAVEREVLVRGSSLAPNSCATSNNEAEPAQAADAAGGKGATAAVTAAQQPACTTDSLAGPAHQPRVHYWRGVGQLLSNPEACIFLSMAVTMGIGVGTIENFLFLSLDQLGGSELLMGLSLTVTCVTETLVFYFLPQILRLGTKRCLHLVLAAFLVRMGCYAALQYAPTPWMVLPVEVLHGLTFALAWGCGSAYCEQLAPPGLEATTQGLFQGLYFGLGVGIGSLLGGHVYQLHGAQTVYLVACAVLAAGWLLCSLAQLAVSCLGMSGSHQKYLPVAVSDVEMNEVRIEHANKV